MKFTTYSTEWIKGEIIKEMLFFIGGDALLLDDETEQMIASYDGSVEDMVTCGADISDIPE